MRMVMSGVGGTGKAGWKHWLARYAVELAFLCLLTLTVAAVVLQDRLLVRTISLTPASAAGMTSYTYGDAESGGSSSASNDPGRHLAWSCRLTPAFRYRYCGYELLIDPSRYAAG